MFALTPFLGDNTRFFKNGRRFSNLSASCGRSFCGSSNGDCSLVRRFCSPKVRESEITGSSFRRFCSPKVRKSDNDFYSFLL